MSNSDFLQEMLDEGEKHSSKPVFKTIGQMTIKLGYSGFAKGHSMKSLFKVYDKPENGKYVSEEVTGRIKELGGSRKAILCMLVEVPDDMVLNSDWGYSRLVNSDETEDWEATVQAIKEFDLPILEPFWCAYQLINSPTAVSKPGDEGKYPKKKDGVETGEMVYPRIAMPIEKFANEKTARDAAGDSNSSSGSSDANSQWSELARRKYPDIATLEANKDQIIGWLNKARAGIPFNNDAENFPLPKEPDEPKLKQYICDIWGDITTADIDILESLDLAPF